MRTFLQVLHVLAAILLIGPLVAAPFYGLRSLTARNHDAVLQAAKWTGRFGLGSLVVAVLGAAVVSAGDEFTFKTPWVIISITLYAAMLLNAMFWARPALRKAAKAIETGRLDLPGAPEHDGDPATPAMMAATGEFLTTKMKLDSSAGRVGGAAGANLLLVIALVILMVAKPFGA